jgi:hypothetical protein
MKKAKAPISEGYFRRGCPQGDPVIRTVLKRGKGFEEANYF